MHNTRKLSLREPLAPWEDREIATVWGRFCEGELTSAALLKLMPERQPARKDMSTHQTSLSWLQDLVICRFQLPEKQMKEIPHGMDTQIILCRQRAFPLTAVGS